MNTANAKRWSVLLLLFVIIGLGLFVFYGPQQEESANRVSSGQVREMYVTDNSATIYMTDNVAWTMTKDQVKAIFDSQTGVVEERKNKTIDLIKMDAKAQLGEGLDTATMLIDFDEVSGAWHELGFGSQ